MSLRKYINRKTVHYNQGSFCKDGNGKLTFFRKEGYATFGGKLSYNFYMRDY